MTWQQHLERSKQTPAVLFDFATAWWRAAEALDAARDAESSEGIRQSRKRLAEITRLADPDSALEHLDAVEADGNRTPETLLWRVEALLEDGRYDEARLLAVELPDTVDTQLVNARLAYLSNRRRAIPLIDDYLEEIEHPEKRAVALSLRARWRAEEGDHSGAREDAAELEVLARAAGALQTRLHAQLMQNALTGLESTSTPDPASMLERVKKSVTDGIDIDPRTLGPIPGHLHAIIHHYAKEQHNQTAFLEITLLIASLAAKAEHFEEAYDTLFYGQKLAGRIFGEEAAARVREQLEHLQRRVGRERSQALEEDRLARERAFMNVAGPGQQGEG